MPWPHSGTEVIWLPGRKSWTPRAEARISFRSFSPTITSAGFLKSAQPVGRVKRMLSPTTAVDTEGEPVARRNHHCSTAKGLP